MSKKTKKRTLIKKPNQGAGEWQDAFLAVLRGSGNIRHSCEKAGIARSIAYKWRKEDKNFADKWNEAKEDAIEALEYEARTRAIKGSDVLLMFLLKSLRPEKYRERYEHTLEGKPSEFLHIYLPENYRDRTKPLPKQQEPSDKSDT